MKKRIQTQLLTALCIMTILIGSACKKEKDKMLPPIMSFKTGAGYTYGDVTVNVNDTILVGVTGEKAEEKDPLTKFVVTQKYDAGSATTVINESFSQDTYNKDMNFYMRSTPGTETYTFTLINRDGITTTKTIVVTVIP